VSYALDARDSGSRQAVRLGFTLIIVSLAALFGLAETTRADITRKSIEYAGSSRYYLISIPPNYSLKRRYPLLLVFHGGGGNPGQVLQTSDIVKRAAKEDWILVAPAGSGRLANRLLTWNVGFGFGYALRNHVDDIGFVRYLLRLLKSDYSVDARRIYATGISNGGILCHLLAAELSDQIAAIAPIVATAGGRAREQTQWTVPTIPKQAVSVIAFNGVLDQRVPEQGGWQKKATGHNPVEMWSVRQTIDFWVKHDQCSEMPTLQNNEPKQYRRVTYSACSAGSEVVQYVLLNQGHAWPGGKKGYWRADEPSRLISANELMFAFFKRHPKQTSETYLEHATTCRAAEGKQAKGPPR
jgi:polyhydroxybutyrate depolymerase